MPKPVVATIMETSVKVKTTWKRKNEKKGGEGRGRKKGREATHTYTLRGK